MTRSRLTIFSGHVFICYRFGDQKWRPMPTRGAMMLSPPLKIKDDPFPVDFHEDRTAPPRWELGERSVGSTSLGD